MRFCNQLISAGLALSSLALASPLPNEDSSPKDKRSFVERDGTNYTVFEHAATGATIEFVTNSGICETTPGVNQYSGYLSVGTNMNMYVISSLADCFRLMDEGGSGSSRPEATLRQHRSLPGSTEAPAAAV